MNYLGKGTALVSVEAIIEFGSEGLEPHNIQAKVDPNNRGVIHILEHMGFKKGTPFEVVSVFGYNIVT
jgi:RimJ/RimL family protein N-acetyltransferase